MLVPEHARRVLRVPLTPLIDVVFILLLFFMLSSSFARQQQIEFKASAAGTPLQQDEARRLLLHPRARVEVGDRLVEIGSAAYENLLAGWQREPRPITVAALQGVPVHELVALLDGLRAAGLANVDLAESVSR